MVGNVGGKISIFDAIDEIYRPGDPTWYRFLLKLRDGIFSYEECEKFIEVLKCAEELRDEDITKDGAARIWYVSNIMEWWVRSKVFEVNSLEKSKIESYMYAIRVEFGRILGIYL